MAYSPEETFRFTITLGSQEIGLNLKSFDISVRDSIYSFAPEVTFTTNDISGTGFESRLNILGQDMAFTVGTGTAEVSYPLTCTCYETPETDTSNGLSGTLKMVFRHAAAFVGKQSEGWERQSPADVFKYLISQMRNDFVSFTHGQLQSAIVEVNHTSRCSAYPLILNPKLNAEDFIDKILLPLANDGSVSTSPYYAYINIENRANFESLKDMMDRAPVKKILFGKTPGDETNAITAIKVIPYSQDYSRISEFIDKTFTYLDQKHEVRSEDISLDKVVIPLALMKSSSTETLVSPSDLRGTIDPVKEAGMIINKERKGLLFDKLIVLVFMDVTLCAGRTVDVEAYLNIPGETKSQNYSGKFIIESSEHLWDASSLMGYTRLILGRMSMQVKGREMHQ